MPVFKALRWQLECTQNGGTRRGQGMNVDPTGTELVQFYQEFAKSVGQPCAVKDWSKPGQTEAWLRQVDSATSPMQLRHFLQDETTVCDEPTLKALGVRFHGNQPAAADKL